MRVSVISKVDAREVLDSRGNPTVEVEVKTRGGARGWAIVPSGASTGLYEAVELRDGDDRFHGKGVQGAVAAVSKIIAPKVIGLDARDQSGIDRLMIELDGTDNKSRLGGNSILGVSIACAKAASASEGLQLYEYVGEGGLSILPIPFFNIINGGKHAGNQLDFQEFMVVPVGAGSFREAVRIGSEIYHTLRAQLFEEYGKNAINVGDEGGFSPPLSRPRKALDAIIYAVEETGYSDKVSLGMDVAASSFFKKDEGYSVSGELLDCGEMIDLYRDLVEAYPIISIEDPLEEEDYEGFVEVTEELNIQILGDDIFVTNPARLRKGIEMGAANALLWKVNQVGTLTEAIDAAKLAKDNGYAVQASHRSGDTEDPFVADLAVGIGCGQIKSGAPARGERTAKYNRLLRIEEWLGEDSIYPTSF
ncbi:MAG: phosphopyruvate hydratase [Candidatus Bathyarchaeota archaeon]|nr:MAG: phosphopyruvate hydratase [Candidatus Bathyarchaeota archaeon]